MSSPRAESATVPDQRTVAVTRDPHVAELRKLFGEVDALVDRMHGPVDDVCDRDHDRREELDREIAAAARFVVDELDKLDTLVLTAPVISDMESYARLEHLAEEADEAGQIARAESLRAQAAVFAESVAWFFCQRLVG